ncbi:MAG TPA: M28 family metallopeptidase [Vicinamibacterales bacterium]|nr:M28 family metallopeptidase [Vicinamibacterales bacterium]
MAATLFRADTAEQQFLRTVSAESIRDFHKFLAAEPHVAGSPRDRALAEWTRDRFTAFGLEDVQIVEHEVLLPYPEQVSVELTAPRAWAASMKEDPVPGDPYSSHADVGIPHHAYSASGDVTAPVVYAGSGNPADYDWLASEGIDVRGKIAIVRYSVPYSYRGFKALTAQQRGAAGILIYSDPADDGAGKGPVYPKGPWGPESHIQRGGVVYDFLVPGDPLTPGWASVPGARRIEPSEAVSLPKIVSAPLSAKDAREIMRALDGPVAPRRWQGGLGFTYRVGRADARSTTVSGGAGEGAGSATSYARRPPATVRMRVRMDDRVRPIWTVTGAIRGAEEPDARVIVGNHRDAWIFGGVDPSSGSAALMELARTLGALARAGERPRRTIVFASWDAEEYTLTSSTEWGEQHAAALSRDAVAYLNVDSAASGPSFAAAAVPSLNDVLADAAQQVRDPRLRVPVASASRERRARERGALPTADDSAQLVNNRLGSGSDYTVFLNHLGIPVADLSFDGPYGVYHSIYDNHNWVSRIGDPGFVYHAALVKIWGLASLRLANDPVLPLDVGAYADAIAGFVSELERRTPAAGELRPALDRLQSAARATMREAAQLRSSTDRDAVGKLNSRLLRFERAFLSDGGLHGRPWYRHQIYAPRFTYAAEVLPALSEAVESGDPARLRAAVVELSGALSRAADALRDGAIR